MLRAVACLGLGLLGSGAWGEVPTYRQPALAARANFSGAFNLPNSAFFTNSTPSLDSVAGVAIHLGVLGNGTQGVFLHDGVTASVVFTGAVDAFLSDVSLNASGRIVFPQHQSSLDGIWFYDHTGPTSGRLTNLPLGASTWGRPQVDDQGRVGFRAGFLGGQAFASWDQGSVAIHATEVGIDGGSPYSFLFTPSTNGQREIAGKVRVGGVGQIGDSQPDEIRIFSSTGSSVLVAEDDDGNAASPYVRFDNSVSLTDNGWVAFVAELAGGVRGVFFSDGTTTRTIAVEGDPLVSDVEFFAPAANDAGLVVFRGRDGAGLQAIFAGDGTTLRRVVGEHDLVATDLGQARLDQHDSSPIFGGGPAVDEDGAIAFGAGLTPAEDNQVEWGSGLFVIPVGELVFGDGFESGSTGEWSGTVG